MKKQFSFLSLYALVAAISFTACQKNDRTTENTLSAAELATVSEDQSSFSASVDAIADDASLALESYANFAGRPGDIQSLICNATVEADSISNTRSITITYDGADCLGNYNRTGVVVISAAQGVQWKNAGASFTVEYQDLQFTRIADNKSVTINGTQTFTNVSGGLLFNLSAQNSITHAITSPRLSVQFDNASTRTWQVAKQRVFSYDNGVVVSASGTHTEGTQTGIAEWGTNRFGGAFTSATVTPLVIRQDCSFRLTSGEIKHSTAGLVATATFGLDVNGDPASCPGGNDHYYFKLAWTGPNGNTVSVILPY